MFHVLKKKKSLSMGRLMLVYYYGTSSRIGYQYWKLEVGTHNFFYKKKSFMLTSNLHTTCTFLISSFLSSCHGAPDSLPVSGIHRLQNTHIRVMQDTVTLQRRAEVQVETLG